MESHKPRTDALVLSSLADIERLRSAPEQLWKLRRPIELRIPHLAPPERERIEYRLNELAEACGCAQGSVAGAVALIVVIAVWVQRGHAFTFRSVFMAAVTVIGASLLGKLVGVITARVRLRHSLGQLLRTAPDNIQVQRGASL